MSRKKKSTHKKNVVLETLTGETRERHVTYDEMLMYFSPAMARKILDEYNTRNRPMPSVSAVRYEGDMENTRWGPCASPIQFSRIGAIEPGVRTLLDGQTRLRAIAESGKGQSFPVIFDVPLESQKYTDRVHPRQFRETLTLFKDMPKSMAAILEKATRRMLYGCTGRPSASHAELEEFLERHEDALCFVLQVFPKYQQNVTTAPVLGALAHAWYYIDDKEILQRYVEILKTGERIVPRERAAKKIREWMMSGEYKGGGQQSNRAFLLVEISISYFAQGKSGRGKLFPLPATDVFPLPEVNPAEGIKNGMTNKTVTWYREHFKRV